MTSRVGSSGGLRRHEALARVLHVVLPSKWLTPDQFEAVVVGHPFAEHVAAGGDVRFEFPATAGLPAGLGLWVLSFLNQLAALEAGHIQLVFGARSGLFTYLDRNGFLQLLSPRIETTPARPLISGADARRGEARGLVEIVPLVPGTTGPARQAIVKPLVDTLIGFYPAGERTQRLRNHVFTVLGELVDNVFSHSQTSLPGYASLQAYEKQRSPRVQIGVSDSGLGIPASLRQTLGPRIRARSDAALVIRAFQDGLSRHGANAGRGCGLLQCARLAADYGSLVLVRTPSAQVTLHPRAGAPPVLRAEVREPVGALAGTHICLEFRVDPA